MINCGPGSNTKAELLGIWALLTLTNSLNIYDLQMFGDSRTVNDCLNHNCALQVCDLICWRDRIRALLKRTLQHWISLIYRDYNQEVDELSKQALLHPEGKITYQMMSSCVPLFLNLFWRTLFSGSRVSFFFFAFVRIFWEGVVFFRGHRVAVLSAWTVMEGL